MFSRIKNKLGERLFKPGDVIDSIDHKIQKYIENGKIPGLKVIMSINGN